MCASATCCAFAGSRSCWRVFPPYIRPSARRVCCRLNLCAMTEEMAMSTANETVLEGVDLVKEFVQGGVTLQVLRGASIHVRGGERIAIVGASGSGKTTLLQLLGGLDLPTRGTVTIAGAAMNQLDDTERGHLRNQAVGFVYQFHHLLPEFTALENVAMPLLVRREDPKVAKEMARALLGRVG